ncbi:ubiquinol oxidase subunit II [Roseibium denhamense]|uniref:Ubiquinol oxidase subunit 2 n=1 Tax=Roseibium denhamense TaxID=76305 RepID=A0ABY1N840_9HYPH|nr:ubiquinol oxidase subunit II [Roseibium denhamense]MTI06000.1 ubiquinol oxidase subunit II [Roseibium denhamense]SMP02211.1 cytochrome bo3 quinol oxidase subunit 2 [Roseibium denhamense]
MIETHPMHGLRLAGQAVKAFAAVIAVMLLQGCSMSEAPILFPKGPVGQAQLDLLLTAFWLMMIVAIPAIVLTLFFAFRYRSGQDTSAYDPDWGGSWKIETVVWLVPAAIIVVLGTLVWTSTHKLDPYKSLASDETAFKVQAIALDWKWLFLYPELGTASVNELAFPQDRPLSVEITSDTVMNSFMIPALGGQIYAMAGMRTELNLIADEPGVFAGRNTMFSGDGFPDQHFKAHAMTSDDFEVWKTKVGGASAALDAKTYLDLRKQSVANPVAYYSAYEPELFDLLLRKYAPITGPLESEAAELICRGGA